MYSPREVDLMGTSGAKGGGGALNFVERATGRWDGGLGRICPKRESDAAVSSTPAVQVKRHISAPAELFLFYHHQTLPRSLSTSCCRGPIDLYYKLDILIMLLSPERRLLSLTMSQIISSDSLTSPISDSSWDQPSLLPYLKHRDLHPKLSSLRPPSLPPILRRLGRQQLSPTSQLRSRYAHESRLCL